MAEKQFVIQQDFILPACFFEASYAFMNRKRIDAVVDEEKSCTNDN